jgi:hypothetical protein
MDVGLFKLQEIIFSSTGTVCKSTTYYNPYCETFSQYMSGYNERRRIKNKIEKSAKTFQ